MSGLGQRNAARIGGVAPQEGKLRRLPPDALAFRLRLPPDRRHLVQDGPASSVLLRRFRELGLLWEQAALLCYALPEREAVWWACMCVQGTARGLAGEQHQALALAQDWVRQPDDAGRLACRQAAKAAGAVSAPACVARAVFRARLSDPGSMQAGLLVTQAIRRAAAGEDPAFTSARLGRFVGSGEAIAAGGAGRLAPEIAG